MPPCWRIRLIGWPHRIKPVCRRLVKRFFRKLTIIPNRLYRKILLFLFIWRLHIEKPKFIILFADSTVSDSVRMVSDNNDAEKRQGVKPTYKKKKGFQPFQVSWGPYLIDAIFRPGNVHCNYGSDFMKSIGRLVRAIRKYYKDVPIIVLSDSGFTDDQNFRFLEERLKVYYICSGKQYADLKEDIQVFACQYLLSNPPENRRYKAVPIFR